MLKSAVLHIIRMKIRMFGAFCLLRLLIIVTAAQNVTSSTVSETKDAFMVTNSAGTTALVINLIESSSTMTAITSPPSSPSTTTAVTGPSGSSTTTPGTSPPSSPSATTAVTNPTSSPSTTTAVTNPPGSSSTMMPITDPTGSPSITTASPITTEPITGNPTSTAKPNLPQEEVLQQTTQALKNITSSINEFLDVLAAITTEAPTTATTEATSTSTAINIPVIAFFKREQKLLMEATVKASSLDTICDTNNKQCDDFLKPLKGIQNQLPKLTTQTDTWQESDLNELQGHADNLALEVAEKTMDTNFMTNVIYKSAASNVLQQLVNEIEVASTAVDAAISDLNSNNDGVIFVAVFCSVGGLIVLALFIGLTVTCVKSKKAKKGNKNKKYSKVPEERVPVEGFKRGLDNDAYHDEERGNTQHDSYAMRNVSRGPAPHSSKTDPHARTPGGRYEDPYAEVSKPKSIADYYSKPGTSRTDDYYSKQGSTRDDGHHARQGASKHDDHYARPAKGPSQGGLNRYYY